MLHEKMNNDNTPPNLRGHLISVKRTLRGNYKARDVSSKSVFLLTLLTSGSAVRGKTQVCDEQCPVESTHSFKSLFDRFHFNHILDRSVACGYSSLLVEKESHAKMTQGILLALNNASIETIYTM